MSSADFTKRATYRAQRYIREGRPAAQVLFWLEQAAKRQELVNQLAALNYESKENLQSAQHRRV